MRTFVFSFSLLLSAAAFAAKPTVSVTSTVQNADGSLTIGYELSGAPAIVCLDIQTNDVSVGGRNLRRASGDVNRLVADGHDFATPFAGTIRWYPFGTDLLRSGSVLDATVKAKVLAFPVDDPPDYMTVNLGIANSYSPSSLHKRGHGVRFYLNEEALPGGLKSPCYRETTVVMRKLHAKDVVWRHGAPNDGTWPTRNAVEFNFYMKFTNDFYLAVFPTTHAQMMAWRGTDGATKRENYEKASEFNAASSGQISYNTVRHSSANSRATRATPTDSSALGILRARTHVAFDLPTSLEWEFACKAGTKGPLYNSDTWDLGKLDEIAWTIHNQPKDASGNILKFTHPVGLLKPNAWGFYDMLGNQWDLCRDFSPSGTEQFTALKGKGWDPDDPAIDPVVLEVGSTSSSTNKCRMGGSYSEGTASQSRVSNRLNVSVPLGWAEVRLYCPAAGWCLN